VNPFNLSDQEVLRICIPNSDLEKRLFDMCEPLADKVHELVQELKDMQQEYDDHVYQLSDESSDEIMDAISLIKAGKNEEAIDKLEGIL
jgi:predicted translin family RNA/ssDNA-binding protein